MLKEISDFPTQNFTCGLLKKESCNPTQSIKIYSDQNIPLKRITKFLLTSITSN